MRQAIIVGWFAFAVLVVGASPAHFWLDSGELAAAGFELGVMHPPGTPGYGLLLRASTLLPLGSLGFRMSVLSCALGAGVVTLVFGLLRRRGVEAWIACGASLWVLCGWTFLRQSRVVEVYTLGALLLLVVLWGADPVETSKRRSVGRRLVGLFAAVWGALAFGDLRIALVVPTIAMWVVAFRRGEAWSRWAPTVVVAASAIVFSLPLASARSPLRDWGGPDTWPRLVDHVSARSIRGAFADEILPASWPMWQHNANALLQQLTEDMGPLGPIVGVMALLGLWLPSVSGGPRPRAIAAALAWLVAVEAFYAIGINPMGIADRQTALIIAPLVALAVGEAMHRLVTSRPRLRPLLVVVGLALILPTAFVGLPDVRETRSWMPHAWARASLEQLPLGSVILTQSDDLSAGVIYAQVVEGARPDVIHLVAQHLYRPVPDALADDPRVGPLWEAARREPTDAARVEAVMALHPGPIALESPTVNIFEAVPFWSETGRPPLRLRTPIEHPVPVSVNETLSEWLPQMQTTEDRKRLAGTLANEARARIRVYGDIDGAGVLLEAVVGRVRPEQAAAWVALGAVRDRQGQSDAAIAMTRLALEFDPDRGPALTNLALYLGRDPATRDEALALAERAVALRPWDSTAWSRLAWVRSLAGDGRGAEDARVRAEQASSP